MGFLVAQGYSIRLQCKGHRRCRLDPWVRKIPWKRAWQPMPVFLPGESHEQRCLLGDNQGFQRVGHDWSDYACMNTPIVNIYLLKSFVEIQLIYHVGLVSTAQQSDSIYMCVCVYMYIYTFHVLAHYGLLKDTEKSSLCYTLWPCCSSILYGDICIWKSLTANLSLQHSLNIYSFNLPDFDNVIFLYIQFSSVTQSCLTFSDPADCSTLSFPVHHQLPELAQTHVDRVSNAIQPSHPLLSPSPPAFNLSQHQDLSSWIRWTDFASDGQSIGASASASVLTIDIRVDFL